MTYSSYAAMLVPYLPMQINRPVYHFTCTYNVVHGLISTAPFIFNKHGGHTKDGDLAILSTSMNMSAVAIVNTVALYLSRLFPAHAPYLHAYYGMHCS